MPATDKHFEYVVALYGAIARTSLAAIGLLGLYILLGASSCH
ncbi:hypothetical protein C7405_101680 [Paraburkholderia caballeronis]|nr:hypothetical protein [Paraburkholderia caballeronis]TDV39561.1 hypothetical protein C7405_101680 [Paraburkholderia caballeronis]